MKKGVLALSVLFLLTSCSLRPLPSQKIAFIDTGFKGTKVTSGECKISVDYSNCNNAFDSYTVYVQTGKNQLEPLSGYEWIDTPCNMVKNSIENTLKGLGCNVVLGAKYRLSFDLMKFQPVLINNRHFCEVEIGFYLYENGRQYSTVIDRKGDLKDIKSFASCMSRLVSYVDGDLAKWINKKIEPAKRQTPKKFKP